MVSEASTCESQSHRFKGTCVSKSNCASVCQTEGFPDGHCRGFRLRCFCSRPC
ncbi:defensin J1-2-like [Prosopis cineraria]|uniref:defensin J1-2-like n=1 Tax=Prosopis cineraria TaxID=364024 RepID=UPI00240FA17B|nr:defensin J1-2-like [Prosopis cineraria]